jgi:hypothetical protein
MRRDVTWIPGEANNGIWKQQLLIYLGSTFDLKILIETGTCDGGTLGGVYHAFDNCYSIELSKYYYDISCNRFKDISSIHLYHGNSSKILRQLLIDIPNVPSLFWLDAHSSGGLTANEGNPLSQELEAIFDLRPDALIVVDDQQEGSLPEVREGWQRDYRCGSLIIQRGEYIIPPFEN